MAAFDRGKTKTNYITITGAILPVRFGGCRRINLRNYLTVYQKEQQIYDLVKFFEDYWNSMYTGYCGYTITESET